jgi:hypothetical protein
MQEKKTGMKSIRKNALNTMFMVALLSSSIFADGEMGGGGRTAPGDQDTSTKTVIIQTTEDGEMGGGGRTSDPGYVESVISSIRSYFDWKM